LDNIRKYKLINHQDNIVVGVSGGPDSMALLYALLYAREYIDFNILIAHVNHGLRGDEALRDEVFVKNTADKLKLPFFSTQVDMVEYAAKHGISEEEAGRELRYGFFREILKTYKGGKIAVAHNMNDQAETLLMRIIRGTGIDGLCGMYFSNEDIIRPLLNIRREEIEEYIRAKGIETVLDRTNLIPIYTRNKIRLELIPYLEENFNPNLMEALWRLSQTSQVDKDFLNRYTLGKYAEACISEDKEAIIIDRDKFKDLDPSIQQRMIILAVTRLMGVFQGFGELHISRVNELFLSGETGKLIQLPKDLVARVDYNRLVIEKASKKAIKPYVYELEIGYNYFSDLGFALNLRLLDQAETFKEKNIDNIKYFDYDKIKGKLLLRNRRSGDRFVPLGMRGSKKLKDFFIDLKISRDERDRIPLILDDENIIWVVGYRISDLYKITKKTKKILAIEFIKLTKED